MAKLSERKVDTARKARVWTRSMSRPSYLQNTSKSLRVDHHASPPPSQSHLELNNLPDDVLIMIFKMLGVEDLILTVPYVCCRWQVLSQENTVWKNKVYVPSDDTPLDLIVKVLKNAPKLQGFYVSDSYVIDYKMFQTFSACLMDKLNLPKIDTLQVVHCERKVTPGRSQKKETVVMWSPPSPEYIFRIRINKFQHLNRNRKVTMGYSQKALIGSQINTRRILNYCVSSLLLKEGKIPDITVRFTM